MKKKILVVEDNELNREILCEILSDTYRVLEAENGQEALDILHQQGSSVSLILLDVMMPVMDGYTFLDRVREDPELSLIPVIVTTQSDSEENEVAALSHGATDFVPKPYRPQVILHRVESLIRLRETAAMVNQFQYDRLTGIYSKEFFYQKVRELLDADTEHEYTIACSDIENFKLYNDTYGREAGDKVLRENAAAIRRFVGEDVPCGRYGADCFLFLLERETARAYREALLGGAFSDYPGKQENISVKWGVYEVVDRSVPVDQMCDRALLAAKSIKGQYNQFFAIYDDKLRGRLLRDKAITDAMETALAERQFVVYFQPKYSLSGEYMAGAEALVRWIHPELGFISPGEFIPLFESNGFISRLDQYVWEQVCACLRSWMDKGYRLLPVSVNVSRADVFQSKLADTLQGLVQGYGINPKYLHLEITESAYAENPGQIVGTVARLRSLGFVVEMDDFGSGYSSLNMLSQMSLDILKLDMKFVQNEIAKPAHMSILNDVVSMAHRLHLSVVAEGVETREQVRSLQAIDCDYAQGYYFAKPMPVDEFERLWRGQRAHPAMALPGALRSGDEIPSLLVVDMDAAYRDKLRQAFAGRYNLLEATGVQEALACIRSGHAEDISVVLLSMDLPEEDARMLMRMLRQRPMYWEIPVIALIPDGETPDTRPLSLDADDYYCKVHPLAVLQRRIQRMLDAVAFSKRETALRDQANSDQLTGLLNRHGLQAALAALRKEELPLAVYLFDLDNLKKVNDTQGHQAGDRLIHTFADLLRQSTRSEDILCRYGGDEFLVILKRVKDDSAALKKGRAICEAFRHCLTGDPFAASCSAGVALCGVNEAPSDALIERADQALYAAKESSKGSCLLWMKA